MKTAREVLDLIDTFLADAARSYDPSGSYAEPQNQIEAKKLWDVLTALRGPDNESMTTKDRTTGYIRRAAFPKLAEAYDAGLRCPGGSVFCTSGHGFELMGEHHFQHHAREAARALNIPRKPSPKEVF